jgi:hypothetical protein
LPEETALDRKSNPAWNLLRRQQAHREALRPTISIRHAKSPDSRISRRDLFDA